MSAAPAILRLVAVVVALEGLAAAGYGVLQLTRAVTGDAGVALSSGVFFMAYGVVLVLAGRGLWGRAGWARGWVMVSHLIHLGLAWNLRAEPTTVLAVVLAVLAVAVLAVMVSRPASAAFED